MKNLHVFQTIKVNLDATIVGHCIDADNNRFLVLTDDFRIFEVQGDQTGEPKLVHHEFDNNSAGLSRINLDDVILVEFIVESGSLLVVFKFGAFIRIGVSSFSPASECIYKHSKNVSSIKLSPDQDLIALADDDNDIFILSADCSIVHSSNALTHNDSVHKPVGVGWGSKETQFFGLDGRPSQEKQTENAVVLDDAELATMENIESSAIFGRFRKGHERSTMIDWRGDGQFLATLTHIPDNGKHYLKVWNRNLELQYMSEQLVTMERGLLSWIPNGQYVCCAQRRDILVNEIAMFEKNGMVHQRVTLPTFMSHLYIKDLLWSPDSKILAVIVVQFTATPDTLQIALRHMIMLYTMQNFHYYLKFSSYLSLDGDHYSLRWNPIHHDILYVSSNKGQCMEYNCTEAVDYSQDNSAIAVVDSNKLLLTPFNICNIPPPMTALTMELDALVTRLVMDSKSIDRIFVLTSDDKLFYKHPNCQNQNDSFKITTCIDNAAVRGFKDRLGQFKYIALPDGSAYQNLTLLSDTKLVATRQSNASCVITQLEVTDSEVKAEVVTEIQAKQVVSIVRDSYHSDDNSIILLLEDGSCVQLNLTTKDMRTRFSVKATSERLYVKEVQFIERFSAVLTLTMDLTLRVNEHIIVFNCCTSVKISENFLIYTTTENMINFIPLDRIVTEKQQNDLGSWNQPIENGGTLILVSEDDSKVILQMPRGNLEILHPRIMVLLRITNYLDDGEYLSAMKLARRYRVDLNFLCDYLLICDEHEFYSERLNKFANEIALNDPALLNLLISELSPEDTTQVRYGSAMKYLPVRTRELGDRKVTTINEKVNNICSTIHLPPDNHFLQPRLLCLLKQKPGKTDEALKLIYNLANKDEKEAALKFILYFVHVDQLFLDAISTYSTDIALMVAGVSSKDPKEYLALLDSFNAIEHIHLRKYKMDLHIKNYERAFTNLLTHLHDSPDKDSTKTQLVDLVVSKRIYKHAIKACFDQLVNFIQLTSEQCRLDTTFDQLGVEIWSKYGDYLLEKRYFLEAGLAYLKSIKNVDSDSDRKLDNVLKCFLLANEWERCVAAIERYKLGSPKREETLGKISNNLMLQPGEKAAAALVRQLVKNDELAFKLAAEGSLHLSEAIVTDDSRCRLHEEINRMIQTDLDYLSSTMETDTTKARDHFDRLKELILTPQKSDHFDGDNCFTSDNLSTVDGSEATSVVSGGKTRGKMARSGAPSIKTRTSSKSNKSQANKKKKINLKVGSRHEDMALVIELQSFIEKQKSTQESVRQLLASQIEYFPSSFPYRQPQMINDLLKERYDLALEITNTLWPKGDTEDNVYSLYKRFGKIFASCESLDNADIKLLLRPEFPGSLVTIEF